MNSNQRVRYNRRNHYKLLNGGLNVYFDRTPVSVLLTEVDGDNLYFSVVRCHKNDTFNKRKALMIARERLALAKNGEGQTLSRRDSQRMTRENFPRYGKTSSAQEDIIYLLDNFKGLDSGNEHKEPKNTKEPSNDNQ